MQAIRVYEFGGPEMMKVEQVDDLSPGPGQVVVQVQAAGVNPVDTYIRAGWYPVAPERPYTPGVDAAGVVLATGADVTRFAPSDRVYVYGSLTGTYAEQCLCDQSQVHPLPPNVTAAQGAAIGVPYMTAYWGLFEKARARPGETVLVHGATGGVGIAAVQLASAAGMQVIGTGGTDRGRVLVMEQGAHHVLDHHDAAYLEKLRKISNGRGVDVILEMLSDVNLGRDLPLLAPGGRVVVIGCRGSVEINPRDLMSRDASVIGMSLMNATREELAGVHAALVAGLERGVLKPVVGREMPLVEAPQAHHDVIEKKAFGKIVLVP